MSNMTQLESRTAIGVHAEWKVRLREMISAGYRDESVAQSLSETRCACNTALDDPQCRILHSQFHDAAREVWTLASAGKRDEALEQMAPGTQFAMSLSALGRALRDAAR